MVLVVVVGFFFVVGVEAETERSNAAVAAASHRVARHRVDVPVAPMLFAAT